MCMTIASELLTNAFYNGPKNQDGESKESDRNAEVVLDQNSAVTFSYGEDDKYFWMKVSDPFGTFHRKSLVKQLLKSMNQDQAVVNFGSGGAGIGLFMIFNWSSQLLFQFDPSKETTVLVKLLKTKRRKIFDSERTVLEIIQK